LKSGIGAGQLMSIVIMLRLSQLLRFVHVFTTGRALNSAWVAALVALLAGVAISLLPGVLMNRHPRHTFGVIAPGVLGARTGKVVAVAVGLFFLVLALVTGRLYSLIGSACTGPILAPILWAESRLSFLDYRWPIS